MTPPPRRQLLFACSDGHEWDLNGPTLTLAELIRIDLGGGTVKCPTCGKPGARMSNADPEA